MGIINWIDRDLNEIREDRLFKYYFNGVAPCEEDGVPYLLNASGGINMVLSDQSSVRSIHLFSANDCDCNGFSGSIPFDLKFSMSRKDTNRIFGKPDRKGGGYTDFLGYLPAWDKWFLENCSLYIQYGTGHQTIDLLAITAPGMESYLDIGLPCSLNSMINIGKPSQLHLSQHW